MEIGIEIRAVANRELNEEEFAALSAAPARMTVAEAKKVFADFLDVENVQISFRLTKVK